MRSASHGTVPGNHGLPDCGYVFIKFNHNHMINMVFK